MKKKCKININTCEYCSQVFVSRQKPSKACSSRCRQKLIEPYYQEYQKAYNAKRKAQKKVYNHVCKTCEAPFQKTRPNCKYCSKECQKNFGKLKKDKAVCEVCSGEFEYRKGKKYCSKSCNKKASRTPKPKKTLEKKQCEWCQKEFQLAVELFGDNIEEAVNWFQTPNTLLFGESPFEVCIRGEGKFLINWLMGRLGKDGAIEN